MLSQIAYVRQQIQYAQRAGTPSARADHLQRALDGLDRVEAQANDLNDDYADLAAFVRDEGAPVDPFLPLTEEDVKAMDEEAVAEMIERAR